MKKMLVTLAFAAVACAANAQPVFKFTKGDAHDFGTLKEGPVAEYAFEFTNVGNEPLIIVDAKADCGCTTPEWPKAPVLPGKTGAIIVRYTTQGHVSPFNKHIYVKSNAKVPGDRERYDLQIKGTVVKASEPEPKKN